MEFELFYYRLQVEDMVMRDKSLNKDAIEIGRVFQETGIIVDQLAILDGS